MSLQATIRLTVTAMPRGGYVKSAALGGSDASNLLLHIDGEARGGLDVVVGTNPGSLDATVQNERQEAVPGVTVVLVPSGAQRLRSELYRSVTSDASGRIHLDSVVPGDYKLFAWENVENGAWQDPEFLRIYEERGKPVRVSEGGRQLADVLVIVALGFSWFSDVSHGGNVLHSPEALDCWFSAPNANYIGR